MSNNLTHDELVEHASDIQRKMGDLMISLLRAHGMSTAMSVMILSCTELLSKTIGAIQDPELRIKTVDEIAEALREGSEKASSVFSAMAEVQTIMKNASGKADDAA